MDINGSVPKRLTYDFDPRIRPAGWTNDGKIIYTSFRDSGLPDEQMIKIDRTTLSYEVIPLAQASDGCYDENGVLYFSRLPKQNSDNKRYTGGWIQQLWKFNGNSRALTEFKSKTQFLVTYASGVISANFCLSGYDQVFKEF